MLVREECIKKKVLGILVCGGLLGCFWKLGL